MQKKTTTTTFPTVTPDNEHCILVGFGPVGQIIYRLLTERGMRITVIDLNLQTVRNLRKRGIPTFYGDILRAGTLEDAGIAAAGILILSADIENASDIIRQVRKINPSLRILARCSHLRDASSLRQAGADIVSAGEAEVGVAFVDAITARDTIDNTYRIQQQDLARKSLYDSL